MGGYNFPIGDYIAGELLKLKQLGQGLPEMAATGVRYLNDLGDPSIPEAAARFGAYGGGVARDAVDELSSRIGVTTQSVPGSPIPNISLRGSAPTPPVKGPGDTGYLVKPPGPDVGGLDIEAARAALDARRMPSMGLTMPGDTTPSTTMDPPSEPGQVRRGVHGEILLTNIPGVGRELEFPEQGYLPPERMDFSNDSGQQVSLNVGRTSPQGRWDGPNPFAGERIAGGYLEGAPDPTEKTWDEVSNNDDYSPLQKQHWVENQMQGLPVMGAKAEIEKTLGEAARGRAEAGAATAQGGLFGAQTGLVGEQTARLRNPLSSAPFIEAAQYIYANQQKYEPIILPLAWGIARKDMEARGIIKPDQKLDSSFWDSMPQMQKDNYLQQAILEYVRTSNPDVASAEARTGF